MVQKIMISQLIFANLYNWHVEKVYYIRQWNKNATGSIFNGHDYPVFRKDNTIFCHEAVDKIQYINDRKRSQYDVDMISRNYRKLQFIYA